MSAKNITYIIIYGLGTLAILGSLAVGSMSPTVARANSFANYDDGVIHIPPVPNPTPYISSIGPDESANGNLPRTILVSGRKFIPTSVGKINGMDQKTTFIDSRHILIHVNPADTYTTNGGFLVTVFNPGPGGGYSNSKKFELPASIHTGNNTNNQNNSYNSEHNNNSQNQTNQNATENENAYKNLAATSIFGGRSLFPSGLIQWVLVAIILTLIVILIRRSFGYREKYLESPLKHA